MDTEVFKTYAIVWILEAIDANGGFTELQGSWNMVPAFVETLIVGWACGRWSMATHPQKFTLEELRRMIDLVHLKFSGGGKSS